MTVIPTRGFAPLGRYTSKKILQRKTTVLRHKGKLVRNTAQMNQIILELNILLYF